MRDSDIFRLLGIVYLAVGLGILFSPDFYKRLLDEYHENPPVIYLSGVLSLVVGYVLVAFHNTWVVGFPVIITVLGWLAFLKGLFILAAPKASVRMSRSMGAGRKTFFVEAALACVLGVFLMCLGFLV